MPLTTSANNPLPMRSSIAAERKNILETFAPRLTEEERHFFDLLDPQALRPLSFCLLILECLHVLETYLNGRNEFRTPRVFRHRQNGITPDRRRRLQALCDSLGWPRFPRNSASADPAGQVAEIWRALTATLATAEPPAVSRTETLRLPPASAFQPHVAPQVRSISQLFARLPNEVLAFGYHGSIGSNDHVRRLSDCDALLILRKGVVGDSASLQRVRSACVAACRRMKNIDRFQHHGIFVLPEELLDCYPEEYFPTVLFKLSSFDLGGGRSVSARVVSSKWVSLLKVFHFSHYLETSAALIRSCDYHTFHEAMQVAQVLPCFVVACCQQSMNKREAIPWVAERSSEETRHFLQTTTRLRTCWDTIWNHSRVTRLLRRPHQARLRDRTIEFFGGPEKLESSLRTLARDLAGMAMKGVRRRPV